MESFSRWLDPLLLGLVVLGVALLMRARFAPATDRRARASLILAAVAWSGLWVCSTPAVVHSAIRRLEPPPGEPLAGIGADTPVAIVVLGAGLKTSQAGIPLRECLNDAGTSRILGGARLFAEHPNAVVILSGGPPIQAEASEDLALHQGVPRDRLEVDQNSANTRENAEQSVLLVKKRGLERVVLVTSALHMRRSIRDFRRVGVEAVPAPVDYLGRSDLGFRNWFPDSVTAGHSYRALHEILGALKP